MPTRPAIYEITFPETQPATEWILDRPVQKVSPQRPHAVLQMLFGARLEAWAVGRGQVGTEWRFRITPPGEFTRPLVPDVAYLSYERMHGLTESELATPPVAPDIVVEILSPDDRAVDVEHKRNVYLAAGAQLVMVVDPASRSAAAYSTNGDVIRIGEDYEPPQFPGLRFPIGAFFARIDLPKTLG